MEEFPPIPQKIVPHVPSFGLGEVSVVIQSNETPTEAPKSSEN